MYNTLRIQTGDTVTVIAWKSKGLSDKSTEPPATPANKSCSKIEVGSLLKK